ncbi:TOG array regulator of axonemal microtubules protein 1-like isoform X2 [Liolophura sinensis]|uniref:TOG array regulator of axonemal microtubules protein 1-like isoform X2 n=1 Tax=Liolophura sinensis TaxID=3198878 RepID=UPI003158E700
MAGKVQLPFGYNYDIGDGPYLKSNPPSSGWNMEEDVVLDQLSDQSFKKRAEILEHLIISARRNGGRLPYSDVYSIYQGLELALSDSNWDVRLKCVQLIHETIPHLEDLDACMSLVLSRLIPILGDSRITLRRAVIQTLHVYMKNTHNVQALLRAIVKSGLESDDSRVRKEAIVALPMLFTPEFANENFYDVTLSLAKKLLDNSSEDNMRETALFTMEKIRNFVGESDFNSYIQKLSPPLRQYYLQLSDRVEENGYNVRSKPSITDSTILPSRSHAPFTARGHFTNNNREDLYEFGIVPSQVMCQIYDQENFKARALAVEELKNILNDLYRLDLLKPHMLSFISFVSSLLDDANFKITTVTLEMLNILACKLGQDVRHYLQPLVSALTKRMSDNKIVVRQVVMKVSMQLMQSYAPKPVLAVICDNLNHRNSKVRQETLNIIIASLLKFPSYDFDLPRLCQIVGPSLLDPKRQVRQAALECYAVLAQAMGTGKLGPLVQAVDQVELNNAEAEGVMAAVQARLARRQLPKMSVDGLIELATPLSGSVSSRGGMQQGADIDWIMAASSGGSGSARTSRSEMVELESVSSRTSSAVSRDGSARPMPAPRRIVSAGRGKNKLPWEDSKDDWSKAYEPLPGTAPARGVRNNQTNDAPPIQPRMTWGGEESIQDGKKGPRTEDNPLSNGSQRISKVKRTSSLRHGGYEDDYTQRDPSWDTGSSVSSHRHTKTKLEPIPGKDGYIQDDTPIPLKPTLARGSATQRSKVPPIIPSGDKYQTPRDEDRDSAYAPSLEGTADLENQAEMMSSLRQIRNSASKKKAAKIFEKLEKEQSMSSRSPSPPLSDLHFESGFYSPASTRDDWSDWSSRDSFRRGGKRSENVFEAKPKLARVGSLKEKKSSLPLDDDKPVKQDSTHQIEFNPVSGVTFRANRSSDVQIVGRGYGEDSGSPADPKMGTYNNKARDRRRLTKGMFDTSPSDQSGNSTGLSERQEKKQLRQTKNYPTGIYGIGVRQNSSDRQDTSSSGDETEDLDDDMLNMSMSKSMRERMLQKKQQRQEEVDKRRKDKEDSRERDRQLERLRGQNSDADTGTLAISGNSSGPAKYTSPTKPPHTLSPRKKSKTGGLNSDSSPAPVSASTKSVVTSENPEDWEPFRDPDAALREAMKYMGQQDWETKCNGINIVRRLCKYHPDVLIAQLHTVNIALIAEVKNLRSQVSRLAVVCVGDMFQSLRNKMDVDLDMVVKALLAKNGESNGFIRDDVDRALSLMVENTTSQRALLAIIAGGATHKNTAVRKTAALFLVQVVERLGPGKVLSGVKDITDRVLPTAAQFVMDSSPETRYNGRKIFHMLMSYQEFDRMLSKHLPANTLKSVSDIVENLRIKGLGDMPSESTSARSRRSGQGSRSSSFRGGSAVSMSGMAETTKRRVVRTDDRTQEEIKQMLALLAASDWRDRYRGITEFLDMCENNTNIIGNQIVKIFDKFLPRLQDPNSKVNLFALQAMLQIIPTLKDWFSSVINMTVQNITPNLNSKNTEIKQVAMSILDMLLEHIDGALLIQPFANQAQSASSRSQPDMVEKVAYLVSKVYTKKQRQVVLHVLPLLWHLIGVNNNGRGVGSGSSPLRTATINLVHSLYSYMGDSLLDHAQSNPAVSSKHLQVLQELIGPDINARSVALPVTSGMRYPAEKPQAMMLMDNNIGCKEG